MDARARRAAQRLPGAVDVLAGRAGKAGDSGIAQDTRDLAHGLEITVRGDGKAGLDHVDAQLFQHRGDAELLLQIHRAAGGLLPVAHGGVEDDDPGPIGPGGGACVGVRTHASNPLILLFSGDGPRADGAATLKSSQVAASAPRLARSGLARESVQLI